MTDNKHDKITIEINNKKYTATTDKTIIEIADANNIYIPRFCYHEKLSVAANCRMCSVEVIGARKLLPACATSVTQDMKIFTNSVVTTEYQKKMPAALKNIIFPACGAAHPKIFRLRC